MNPWTIALLALLAYAATVGLYLRFLTINPRED